MGTTRHRRCGTSGDGVPPCPFDREQLSFRVGCFEAAAGLGVAERLAADLGLDPDVLHPIEQVAAGESCPELMTANLAAGSAAAGEPGPTRP